MRERILGLDLGAETVKVAELVREGSDLRPQRTWSREHGKDDRRSQRSSERALPDMRLGAGGQRNRGRTREAAIPSTEG